MENIQEIKFGRAERDSCGIIKWSAYDHLGVGAYVWRDEEDTIYLVKPEEGHPFGDWLITSALNYGCHYEDWKAARQAVCDLYEAFQLGGCEAPAAAPALAAAQAGAIEYDSGMIPPVEDILPPGFLQQLTKASR